MSIIYLLVETAMISPGCWWKLYVWFRRPQALSMKTYYLDCACNGVTFQHAN